MARREDLVLERLEKIDDHLGRIDVTLAEQHVSLKEHVRRSDLLEKKTDLLEKELRPVALHVAVVGAIAKVVAISSSVAGVVWAAIQIYFKVRG